MIKKANDQRDLILELIKAVQSGKLDTAKLKEVKNVLIALGENDEPDPRTEFGVQNVPPIAGVQNVHGTAIIDPTTNAQ